MVKHTCSVSNRDGKGDLKALASKLLTEDVIENIKVRICFATHVDRGKAYQAIKYGGKAEKPKPPPSVKYPLSGDYILDIPGQVREEAYEVLFEQDVDGKSLATMILDSILRCPLDLKKKMAESILVVGGTSMTPGFHARLKDELFSLLKSQQYSSKLALTQLKFFTVPGQRNYTAWLGAAIFGALETIANRSLGRDEYTNLGKVPDWTHFQGNKEEKKIGSKEVRGPQAPVLHSKKR